MPNGDPGKAHDKVYQDICPDCPAGAELVLPDTLYSRGFVSDTLAHLFGGDVSRIPEVYTVPGFPAAGEYRPDLNRAYIRKGMSREQTEETMLHEIVHAADPIIREFLPELADMAADVAPAQIARAHGGPASALSTQQEALAMTVAGSLLPLRRGEPSAAMQTQADKGLPTMRAYRFFEELFGKER